MYIEWCNFLVIINKQEYKNPLLVGTSHACTTHSLQLWNSDLSIMTMWSTIIVVTAILGASLVLAKDDTCTRYGFDIDNPGVSCADIYNKNPASHGRSGYYVLKTDYLLFAYCDMELDCGGNKGGWMKIADIKKGDTPPSGWTRRYTQARSQRGFGRFGRTGRPVTKKRSTIL